VFPRLDEFLTKHGIEFITSGANVAAGNVNVRCPFCGRADPSYHMGIVMNWSGWGCWRNSNHRGRSPYKLVMALLGVTYAEARRLLGSRADVGPSDPDKFQKVLESLRRGPQEKSARASLAHPPLSLPKNFRPVDFAAMPTRFFNYLTTRGYKDLSRLARVFKLHYCVSGEWANRIIFPVDGPEASLASWTGRSIYQKATPRYLSLSKERSALTIKDCVWPYSLAAKKGARLLVITEGPFDALKINYLFARSHGVRSVCTFGTSISARQQLLLRGLSDYYKSVVILPDPEAYFSGVALVSQLTFPVKVIRMPESGEDPGGCSRRVLSRLLSIN
jgi:hypothetical protein